MELQITMQKLLEGASHHSENSKVAEVEASRVLAEKEMEKRRKGGLPETRVLKSL
jgi:hypothetical protein